MHWEKQICIRLTIRRIVVTILAASAVTNLVIVGVVVGAESPTAIPTATSVLSTTLSTNTFLIPISGAREAPTLTQIPNATRIDTFTSTSMSTDLPIRIVCMKRFYWPSYHVQLGDTLFSLASAIGSSAIELMSANCLTSDQLYAGQLLYMPRLPNNTITPTPTNTPTDTSTATQTFTNIPTDTNTPNATQTWTDTPPDTPTNTQTSTSTPSSTATFAEPNSPPSVNITFPKDGSRLPYTGFDTNLNLWYSKIELRGSASDPEDDILGDSSLIWSTDQNEIHNNLILGQGIILNTTLYSNICAGLSHKITLTGTDSKGAIAAETITIFIGAGQLC